MSMKDAWNLMRDSDANTLPIVDEENRLQGLITMTDVATAYMDAFDAHTMADAKTTYENMVQTLDGAMVVGDVHESVCDGRVPRGRGQCRHHGQCDRKGRYRNCQ